MASNKRLSAVITIGGAISGTLKGALGTTKSKMLEIGGAIDTVKKRQQELNRVIKEQERLGKSGSALKIGYAQRELEATNKEIAALRVKHGLLRRNADAQHANAARRGELRGKIGSTMVAGATFALPIIGALAKSTEFNYQLQLIGNTAEMSRGEIVTLGATIIEAGKQTGHSSQDMQRALGFLIAAGMDLGIAQRTVTTVGKAATATGGEIEDLARAAFTLNNSLKIAPEDMQASLDTLAKAGKEGNVELKDMAKVLPVLGSGFQSLKMEGREAAATIGAALEIARKGAADADEAANNMKNYVAKIMSPETLKKAKKHFNIDLYKIIQDSQKSGGNPFEASMQAIIKATGGDQKKIGELFSDMQVQNFIRPMIQNWEKYKEIKDKSLKADGTIDRDFDSIMATSKQKIKGLTTEIGRLGIAVGDALEGSAGDKSSSMENMIGSVTKFVNENRTLVGITLKVVGGLIGIRLAALGVGYAFTMAKGGALLLSRAFLFLGSSMLLNPLGLAITAIALVAAGAYLVYKNWEPIKKFFITLWEDITAIFKKSLNWIVEKFEWVGNAAKTVFGAGGDQNSVGALAFAGEVGHYSPAPSLPALPPIPRIRGAAPAINDNSQTNINVTQLPGESTQDLANRIIRIQEERKGVRQRGTLYDSGAS